MIDKPVEGKEGQLEPDPKVETPSTETDGLPTASQTPTSEELEPGSQTEFTHGTLKGRTNPQVEAYVSLLEQTVGEQSNKLTEVSQQLGKSAEEPKEEGDFFATPREMIAEVVAEQIAPLTQYVERLGAGDTRAALRLKYDDFSQYEPAIDQLLTRGGFDVNTSNTQILETLYYTAVGLAAKAGPIEAAAVPATERTGEVNQDIVRIPQHRPSASPVPSTAPGPKLRDLTENEETLRKEWGMTKEQYLREQDMDAGEVAEWKPEEKKNA